MPREQRKKNDDALLLALACGSTAESAARQCGLAPRTVYRRLKQDGFAARLRQVRADLLARAAGLLTAAGLEAVKTLVDLQKPGVAPATRLGAARAVLEIGLKVREVVDLQAQVVELERRLDEAEEQQRQHRPGPNW